MTIWQLHMLNARSALTPIMAEIRSHSREVVSQVSHHLDLPRFDLVVRAGDRLGPDIAIMGNPPSAGIIDITLDPARVEADQLRRTLVRRLYQLSRLEGPGYGLSLGEVLVSEGLAGHFVVQMMGAEPDPCDVTRPGQGMLKQVAGAWARRNNDLEEWFNGRGKIRKWTGYGIGYRLVAEYLAQSPDEDAASLVWQPADSFRSSLRRLMAADGIEDPDFSDDENLPEQMTEQVEADTTEASKTVGLSGDALDLVSAQ